jgi:peptide/nickel transport system substrate-binding protein
LQENKWQGFNLSRYVNQDYDSAIAAANAEIDPFKRASLSLSRPTTSCGKTRCLKVAASSNTLRMVLSGWSLDTDHLQDWYREEAA